MTPKERWLAVLNRQTPDRLPMDYWATDETTTRLMKHLDCPDELSLIKQLHIDRPVTVQPKYIGPPLPPDGDMYGRRFQRISYSDDAGSYRECIFHPLAEHHTIEAV